MSDVFDLALGLVLQIEGDDEFTDDPHDLGGATRWGISLRFALAVGDLDRDGRPDLDVDGDGDVDAADIRALPREKAVETYRAHFWELLRCPEFPLPLAVALFDCGVNQGRGPAVVFLQAALRVTVDGKLGPRTLVAARRPDAGTVLEWFFAHRIAGARTLDGRIQPGYAALAGWARYGLGWTRRCFEVHRACLRLA